MSAAASRWRLLLRVAAVLCLLLAALVLGADHQEYRQLTRAGMRALAWGALPLLATGAVALRAVEGDAPWPLLATIAAALLLGRAASHLRWGSQPPYWPLVAIVAALLLLGAAGTWRAAPPDASAGAR